MDQSHSGNMTNVLKGMIKSSLNSYNKILPSTQINIDDLLKKSEEINLKLNPKRSKDAIKGQMSLNEKSAELDNKKLSELNYIDTDTFRLLDNKYVPRLKINQMNERESERNKDKENSFCKGIMSLQTSKDFHVKKNNLKIEKQNESFRLIKNDSEQKKQQNYSFNPLFFLNQYFQYVYHDEREKMFDDNDLLRTAFEKNMKKNLLSSLNLTKKDSPFMQSYNEILNKTTQVEQLEQQDLALCYQYDETEEDDDIKYSIDKELVERQRNRQSISFKSDGLMEYFKSYFIDQAQKFKSKRSPYVNPNPNVNVTQNNQTNSQCHFIKKINQYTYKDITFGFCIESGLISYPNRIQYKENEIQLIELNGPSLIIYDKEDNNEIEAEYDLRCFEKELDALIANPIQHKLNGEIILNNSGTNRTIGSLMLFKQIASFFNSLKANITYSNSFNTLMYLTHAHVTHLDLTINSLLNVIQWHNNLISLTIRYDLIEELLNAIESNWHIPESLETLTVIKSEINDESNYDAHFYNLFSKECSIYIRNIHLINIDYSETIHSALLHHIEQFYYIEGNKRLNDSIPILNLSIKKSKQSMSSCDQLAKETKVKKGEINLNMIYSVFIVMLHHMIECNRQFPLVFNRLDLTNQSCYNVQGLVKIITKFKLIKELDITNSKVKGGEYLIDSIQFLPLIRVSNKGYSNMKTNDNEYEMVYRNEFKILKDNNYHKASGSKEEGDDLGYDLSFGVYPILENIIFENTSRPQETVQQLYYLFKRLKFFQGFPIPNAKDKKIEDEIISNIIKEDMGSFCENIFEYECNYYQMQ